MKNHANITGPILELKNITKTFPVRVGYFFSREVLEVTAVDDVSLHINPGEIYGLAGESGCGKTTLGRITSLLLPADSGRVLFKGEDITGASGQRKRDLRKEMQVIFQDPLSSLNPRMSVFEIVSEPLIVHKMASGGELREQALETLREAGLDETFMDRFPHQLSGGQRQRVMTARALILKPSLIIADEPVSALDVSVQAGLINLFQELREKHKLSMLFISHDLAVLRYLCDRIGVMFKGRIIEEGPAVQVLQDPKEDYTKTLLSAVPEARLPG